MGKRARWDLIGDFEAVSKTNNIPPDAPPLDRWRMDQMLEPDRPLWGLPAIARAAGVSVDTARRWHQATDAPISKPGGRHFAWKRELLNWLTAK